MMKLIVLCGCVALAVAIPPNFIATSNIGGAGAFAPRPIRPVAVAPRLGSSSGGPDGQAQILRSNADVQPDGSYQWAYETSNGISAEESGSQRQVGNDAGTAAQGSFRYTAPDGTPIAVQYVADENGFQPQGAHLPTPPPIPLAIQRSLEWNAAHPEPQQQPGLRIPAGGFLG